MPLLHHTLYPVALFYIPSTDRLDKASTRARADILLRSAAILSWSKKPKA